MSLAFEIPLEMSLRQRRSRTREAKDASKDGEVFLAAVFGFEGLIRRPAVLCDENTVWGVVEQNLGNNIRIFRRSLCVKCCIQGSGLDGFSMFLLEFVFKLLRFEALG